MLSVSEQLQKYRAMNAGKGSMPSSVHTATILRHHPSTKDYFRTLMQRWQDHYAQSAAPFSQNQAD